MPAPIMNAVASNTRNTLRADHSMIRPSMSVHPVIALAEAAQRRLEVALGVDQEVRADHHALARLDPVEHFDVSVGAHPQSYRARFERSLAALHQHQLARASVEDGRIGNGQYLAAALAGGYLHPRIHGGLEQARRIGQFDSHLGGAGFRRDGGVDKRHLAGEGLVRISVKPDFYRLPQACLLYTSPSPRD